MHSYFKKMRTHHFEVLELDAHELVDAAADLTLHLEALLLAHQLRVVLLRQVVTLVAGQPHR